MERAVPPRSRFRRFLGAMVTIGFFALSAAAVVFGGTLIADSRDSVSTLPPPAAPVWIIPVELKAGYTVTRRFVGQIEAGAEIGLGFELGGRITEVLVDEGDTVSAGAVLARLDTSALIPERAALEAELAALAADAELARLTVARNDALTERGFRSVAAQDEARLALARAEAGMAALRARIAGVDVRLDKSVLRAPFAARVGARKADPGQTVSSGQPVLILYDRSPTQMRVGVPADLAEGLRPADPVRIAFGDEVVDGTIRHIRPDLDPATRSRPVVVELRQDSAPVLGVTADLLLTQEVVQPGFWAPLSALREGVRGSWSVYALEATPDGDVVRTAAVEVIHSDGERVFLRGALPTGARVVAEAPDRVVPGQVVLPQLARLSAE